MDARANGAKYATGDTITFLDRSFLKLKTLYHPLLLTCGTLLLLYYSHIETNKGWLEPLLSRIAEDPKHVVMVSAKNYIHALNSNGMILTLSN